MSQKVDKSETSFTLEEFMKVNSTDMGKRENWRRLYHSIIKMEELEKQLAAVTKADSHEEDRSFTDVVRETQSECTEDDSHDTEHLEAVSDDEWSESEDANKKPSYWEGFKSMKSITKIFKKD